MGQRVRRAGDDYWVSIPGDRVDDVSWAREGEQEVQFVGKVVGSVLPS